MATKITSYNPCKDDPYGASSMPIYQVGVGCLFYCCAIAALLCLLAGAPLAKLCS